MLHRERERSNYTLLQSAAYVCEKCDVLLLALHTLPFIKTHLNKHMDPSLAVGTPVNFDIACIKGYILGVKFSINKITSHVKKDFLNSWQLGAGLCSFKIQPFFRKFRMTVT